MTLKVLISTALISAAFGLAPLSQAAAPTQVKAQEHLGADWMQSPWHSVNPIAMNDGIFNSYEITTPDGTYVVRGTSQARLNIREIYAIYQLRERSVVGTAANSLTTRTINWVKSPLRAVGYVGKRVGEVDSVEDAVLFAPKAVYDTGETVVSSVGEFAVTGKRIVTGAAGTKCDSFGQCVSDAGSDVWSGLNSLLGKHNAARRLHAEFGTDRQTQNKLLRREIDRLSYTEAYTGSAFKYFVPRAEIDVLSDYQRGIGYFNNAEFAAGYTDAHRPRNAQKKMLSEAGASKKLIDKLYKSELYTHNQRTALADALTVIRTKSTLGGFVAGATEAQNREEAQNIIDVYSYLASQIEQGQLTGFAPEPVIIAQSADGGIYAPMRADYLQWNDTLALTANILSANARKSNKQAQLHVLGQASPEISQRLNAMGIRLVQTGLY